jgi:hypothetical protein
MKNILTRSLVIVGLVGMIGGAIDPLEGSVVILAGAVLLAMGGFLGQSRWRPLHYWSLALVAVGVAALFVLSSYGGVGGETGRSYWWLAVALPYPIGWIAGLVGAVLALVEYFRHPAPPAKIAT